MPQDPQTYRQYAYLDITGNGPSSRITETLGLTPDEDWSEGDPWQTKGRHRTRRFTYWKLNSGVLETEDLNTHTKAILQRLYTHESALKNLTGEYDVRLVLVSYNLQGFSFELDFRHQRHLTQLGIRTWFDAYIDEDVHKLMFDIRSKYGRDVFDSE
ncbi:DUF4279 domain-containing protein [Celeribacter sp.]|uniref:DUF4279 domain-containing protein n=1 Tax=Celeribacter sp. TaxID=1890673 RepID=UPI003A91F6C0